jgi:hypothetical protein
MIIHHKRGHVTERDPNNSLLHWRTDGMCATLDSGEMGTFIASLYSERHDDNGVFDEVCTLIFESDVEAERFCRAAVRAMSEVQEEELAASH